MDDVFISEFFGLDDAFEQKGVFDSIMNHDSHFFINLLRLKKAKTPEFQGAYGRINDFFDTIMILLDGAEKRMINFIGQH